MSSRALRKLREEKELAEQPTIDEESESDEEESDEEDDRGGGGGGFAAMAMMDSDSSLSDESSVESESENEDEEDNEKDEDTPEPDLAAEEEEEEEKDIDAILSEFQSTSVSTNANSSSNAAAASLPTDGSSALLSNLDARDLDLERSMGALLGGGGGGGLGNLGLNDQAEADAQAQRNRMHPAFRGRNQRGIRTNVLGRGATPVRKFAFGRPGESWGRPPSFVGGGLGMDVKSANEVSALLPWPYSTFVPAESTSDTNSSYNPYLTARWHSFTRSDSYAAQCIEYEHVSSSGDVNALALFVADNPYHAEASLQLSSVLFHTNNREAAMDLLRRVLWIYEYAAPASFLPGGGGGGGGRDTASSASAGPILMDQSKEENAGYFSALFRLMRSSCMVGCINTSLAVSRYILSLDPLRDPMGVLLTMDYFALCSVKDEHARFVVELVDSKTVELHHKEGDEHCRCELTDMPNWAFAYALALYRLKDIDAEGEGDSDDLPTFADRADEALRSALIKFPPVLELLLEKNEVDVTGRSFKMDWPTVLAHFRKLTETASKARPAGSESSDADSLHRRALATAAGAHVIRIFIQRSHKLWSGDDVLRWLYDACAAVAEAPAESDNGAESPKSSTFHPALIRYMSVDPTDYEDAFTTLPADANPLDPALVAPALALDPNRRRLGRRMPRGGGGNANDWQQEMFEQLQMAGGGFGGEMNMVDPDLPLVEVFWRSLMPWNHVEGVPEGAPPPDRQNA